MKKRGLFLLLFFCSTFFVKAVELNYKWKAGSMYRFQMTAQDNIAMNMNMMGMTQKMQDTYHTTTALLLTITSVSADGTAEGELYVENFSVKDSKGNKLAGLESIPSKALKTSVSVDKKGNFTFYKKVYILVKEKTNMLLSAKASMDGKSISATATAGGEEVSLYAEFDPNTGTLKAGYSQKSVSTPTTKKVEVTQEDQRIDIIPFQVLDLLVLPKGNTEEGDEVTSQAGYYTVNIKTTEVTSTHAQIRNTISTDKNASAARQSMDAKTDQGSMDMGMGDGMNMDMADMDDMDMAMDDFDQEMDMPMDDGMGGSQSPKDMMPETSGTINVRFNIEQGIFEELNGQINTKQKIMGVETETSSTITLTMVD